MNELVENTGAVLGFTQSDEISLVFYGDQNVSNLPFNGRIPKIVSVFASMASAKFNFYMSRFDWDDLLEKHKTRILNSVAFFDARAFSVPDHTTAMEGILNIIQIFF